MRLVRTCIEAGVLLSGFLLGGTVGVGAMLYALTIGPITHRTIPAMALRPKTKSRTSGGGSPCSTSCVWMCSRRYSCATASGRLRYSMTVVTQFRLDIGTVLRTGPGRATTGPVRHNRRWRL